MVKKKRSSTSYSRYESFRLHGKFTTQTILISSGIAFISGFMGGMYFQPYSAAWILALGQAMQGF